MTQENTVTEQQEVKKQILVDTADLQLEEIVSFARILGFSFNGKSFVRDTKNRLLKTVTIISFRNMTRIYQAAAPGEAVFIPSWSSCGKYSFFVLNQYSDGSVPFNLIPFYTKDVKLAFGSKTFKKIKVQLTREGDLTVLSHKLEFVDPNEGTKFQTAVDEFVKGGQ